MDKEEWLRIEAALKQVFLLDGDGDDAAIKLAYGVRWNLQNAEPLLEFVKDRLLPTEKTSSEQKTADREDFLLNVHCFVSNWELIKKTQLTLCYEDED